MKKFTRIIGTAMVWMMVSGTFAYAFKVATDPEPSRVSVVKNHAVSVSANSF